MDQTNHSKVVTWGPNTEGEFRYLRKECCKHQVKIKWRSGCAGMVAGKMYAYSEIRFTAANLLKIKFQ